MSKAKIPVPTRGLACHCCGSEGVTVSDAQQMLRALVTVVAYPAVGRPTLRRESRRRLHAHVRCRSCGHEWWSRHPTALRLSREADKAAAGA